MQRGEQGHRSPVTTLSRLELFCSLNEHPATSRKRPRSGNTLPHPSMSPFPACKFDRSVLIVHLQSEGSPLASRIPRQSARMFCPSLRSRLRIQCRGLLICNHDACMQRLFRGCILNGHTASRARAIYHLAVAPVIARGTSMQQSAPQCSTGASQAAPKAVHLCKRPAFLGTLGIKGRIAGWDEATGRRGRRVTARSEARTATAQAHPVARSAVLRQSGDGPSRAANKPSFQRMSESQVSRL